MYTTLKLIYLMVGTVFGLNFSIIFGLMGTQTLPVFGCTQNGDFNK